MVTYHQNGIIPPYRARLTFDSFTLTYGLGFPHPAVLRELKAIGIPIVIYHRTKK